MSLPASEQVPRSDRVWLLWVGVVLQQFVFVFTYSLRCPLIAISEWVIYVPIVIVWALYIVTPFLIPRAQKKRALLRAYATTGWIFAIAAVSWNACYLWYSKKDGTPVSYERLMQMNTKRANKRLEPTATIPPPSATSQAPLAHP